jgi:hypothetical protein
MAQGVGLEFKPQHRKKKKKTQKVLPYMGEGENGGGEGNSTL